PCVSVALTAIVITGMQSDLFAFECFLPRNTGEKSQVLAGLAHESRTLIFYESPHRTAATLEAMAAAFGAQRAASVARELTKYHEEVVRGRLSELIEGAT